MITTITKPNKGCSILPTAITMNTLYATTDQAEKIEGTTTKAKCSCGESYAIITQNEIVIICNACTEEADSIERFF
jgi:hypothetical protein